MKSKHLITILLVLNKTKIKTFRFRLWDHFGPVWDQNHVYFHGRFGHAYLPQNSPNLTFLTEVSLILSCILKSILDPSLTTVVPRSYATPNYAIFVATLF